MACEQASVPDVDMVDAALGPVETIGHSTEPDGDVAPAAEEASAPPEDRVPQAESAKEAGNLLLKAGDFAAATAKYKEGIELVKALLEKDAKEEMADDLKLRCTAVHAALRLNSAQACLKQSDWVAAAGHADEVLLRDGDNCKALYRRAMACCNLETEGRLEQAVADCTKWAKLEPTSREAREQLKVSKDKLKELRQKKMETWQKAMSGGLYKEQHAMADRHRMAYEEEAKRRKEAEEDEISFEDWHKKQKEEEEKAKNKAKKDKEQAAEQRSLDEENARRRDSGEDGISLLVWKELKKKGTVPKTLNEVCKSDDIEMDEDEKKMLAEQKSKGYYHGRLGRVLSDEAPKPQKVERSPLSPGSDDADPEKGGRGSHWNVAGTWEERNMTTWAKERLTSYLKAAAASSSSSVTLSTGQLGRVCARVESVTSLKGDAQIVMVRREPRFGYNFEANLSFRVGITLQAAAPEDGESKEEVFEGAFFIYELVDSVPIPELQVAASWKGGEPREQVKAIALEWTNNLRDSIRSQIALFAEEYKAK